MFKGTTPIGLIDRQMNTPWVNYESPNSPYQERNPFLGELLGIGLRGLGTNIDPVSGIDLDTIGVTCTDGVCTDLQFGDTFADPTPVALGIGIGVGMMVNPIVGAVAGAWYWYTQGRYQTQPKPLTQGG